VKRLVSALHLGFRILVHFLLMPFRGAGRGERVFLENYREDRLAPLLPEERQLLPALDRCIACGLCNAVCERLGSVPRHVFGGPFALATAARSMPDFTSIASGAEHAGECGECDRCRSVCPTGVPLDELARFVRSRAARASLHATPRYGARP